MKIDLFDIFKDINTKRKFIVLFKLDLQTVFKESLKFCFKDDKIFVRFLANIENHEEVTEKLTNIIKGCFERCKINYIRVKGDFYIRENNEYVYIAELDTNTEKLINAIKMKLYYDEISLKDLRNLL